MGGTAVVELAAGQRIADVTIQVARYASIAGMVRDEFGDPVVDMRVEAYLRRTAGFKPLLLARGGAKTDDRGQYRIGNLPPGEYLICACGRETLPIDKGLLPVLGAPPPTATAVSLRLGASVPTFPPTFHPKGTRSLESTSISVGPAEDRAGIDISVRAIVPRRVSGQLVGIGLDPTGLTLLLFPDDSAAHAITAVEPVQVTAKGGFEFVGVPPGRYWLDGYPTKGKQDRWASMAVTVGEEDVTGLIVPLSAGTPVSGQIRFSGGSERPNRTELERSIVSLVPVDLTPRTMNTAGMTGRVGFSGSPTADGTFRIDGVPPGRYMVSASRLGPDWQLVESVTSGPDGLRDRLVTVGPQGLSDVVISMTDTVSAMVLGTVVLQKYESPQSVRVLLFPAESATWSEQMRYPERFAMTSLSDRDALRPTTVPPGEFGTDRNTFRLTTVPPGEYFVTTVSLETYLGPEQLERLSRTATRLSLREGQTTSVELKHQRER